METGGQCRLRPSAGLDKEVLSFQKEVLRVSLFSNYSKKLLKTGPPVLIICTFSMELGARWTMGFAPLCSLGAKPTVKEILGAEEGFSNTSLLLLEHEYSPDIVLTILY